MGKLRKLVRVLAILFLLQRIVLLLNDQPKLKKGLISPAGEPRDQLKCVFDDTNARGFCGIIPAHLFLGHRNATLKYRKANFKGGPIMVWHKQCHTVDENSPMEGLPGKHKLLLQNQSDGAKFGGSRTWEDKCEERLIRYFESIKEALDTSCSNGIRDMVGGLPTECIGEETLPHGSCGQNILIELIDRFHLTVEYPDQRETVAEGNYFIDLHAYLAEIHRNIIRKLLNSLWQEKILDSRYDLGTLVFTLPRLKSKIHVHHVNLNSLSYFSSYGSVLYVQNARTHAQIIADPARLLGILAEELSSTVDPKSLNELRLKLNSHILNAVLVNWHKYETAKSDLWRDGRYIYDNSTPKDTADYSYKFEKFVSNGPPYYPFSKSKVGFSVRDILDYSPDFRPKIRLMLAAVHTSVVGIATNAEDFDYGRWFAHHFPEEWNRWLCALNTAGINAHNYLPLPIHPWQFTHSVQKLFVDLIDSQMLVPLDVAIEASPTSSPRTLLSTRNLSAPYVKVPIGIQATSSLRTYPVNTVKTAPAVSQLMATILANESSISEKLSIIREDVGIYLKMVDAQRAQHLTATFRQNVLTCLAGQEIAIPVAALFEKLSPDTSLLVRIMQFAGCTSCRGAVQYFTRYVHLVLSSYLDLYLIYGVALEGHQQNTLAIFENSRVKRFVAKDFTETKISLSVSKSRAFLRNLTTSGFFKNFNDFVVRAQLLHYVYQMHLGELLVLVAEHFGCSERLLWRIVADETRERFEALEERVDGARWRREYDAILKADWPARSYLQNHFESEYVEKYLYYLFRNPLN